MQQRARSSWRRRLLFMALGTLLWREVCAQIRYSLSEEQKEGSVVGNLAKDLGLDTKTLKERGFRIVSTSGDSLFSVNQNDGILSVMGNRSRGGVARKRLVCHQSKNRTRKPFRD